MSFEMSVDAGRGIVDQMRDINDTREGILAEAYSWVTNDLTNGFIAATILYAVLYGAGRVGRSMGKSAKD
jgi:hypothetical protein